MDGSDRRKHLRILGIGLLASGLVLNVVDFRVNLHHLDVSIFLTGLLTLSIAYRGSSNYPMRVRARNTVLLLFLILFPLLGLLMAGVLGLFLGFVAASLFFMAMRQIMLLSDSQEKDRQALKDLLDQIKTAAEIGDNQKVVELVGQARKKR